MKDREYSIFIYIGTNITLLYIIEKHQEKKNSCDIKLNAVQKIYLVLYDLAWYLQVLYRLFIRAGHAKSRGFLVEAYPEVVVVHCLGMVAHSWKSTLRLEK